jgi:hypothetical protein
LRVEDVAGKSQVQGGVGGVNSGFVRSPNRVTLKV